jgi:uncharacterized protein YdhG (YjbR/CyaY superfamily)
MTSAHPKSVDEYIGGFPLKTQRILKQIRSTIRQSVPDAEETISYRMPAYKLNGILVYFAGYENHIGFYALPRGNDAFEKELSRYKTGKGSVQFLIDQPIPLKLIERMVRFRAKENLKKWKSGKSAKS